MKDSNATLLLGTEPIGKLLLRYSLPAIAAMVVFSLYNVIDSIFIGHGVGPLAISGLAITFPVMNLTFALVMLVGIGGASISSIRLGQQDMEGTAAAEKVRRSCSIRFSNCTLWGAWSISNCSRRRTVNAGSIFNFSSPLP